MNDELLREAHALICRLKWQRGLGTICHGGLVTSHGCPSCHCHGSGREHHVDSGTCALDNLARRVAMALGEPAPTGAAG